MRIQYLGTGAAEGVPALFCVCALCKRARETGGKDVRTRSGALIDGVLKLDFPPDTYHHLITHHIDITELEHLLISHPHEDHYAYSELLYRVDGFAQLYPGIVPLTVYGGKEVGEKLAERLDDRSGADERVRFHHMKPFTPTNIGQYWVTALPSRHMREAESYIYLIEKDGKKLLYAHDSGLFFDEVYDYLAGKEIDMISLDCTYMNGDTRENPENGHMGLPANRVVRDKLSASRAAAKGAVFVVNHFSHNGGMSYEELSRAAGGFVVSYDGLELTI